MRKKFVSVSLALALCAGILAGCRSTDNGAAAGTEAPASEAATGQTAGEADTTEASGRTPISAADVKVGIIYIGDENEGYTAAHMAGIDAMQKELGISDDQVIEMTGIPEDESSYDAVTDLVGQGCNIVFANSFGQEDFVLQAAKEHPEVEFCHATGYQAKLSGLPNMHNYFTAVYESRYVSGVVAGMKLNEMIADGTITEDEAKLGYVGAYPYAEVISGFTSFFLGVRSQCPSATMEVKYTNSWSDMAAENATASELISDGCVLISQHADTTGAPAACEKAGVYCVGYNIDMIPTAPNEALTSASINWGPYYTYAVRCLIDGAPIATDWCQGFNDGAVKITALNDAIVAEGTEEKVKEAEDGISNGTLHVFDTSTFTVGGKSLEDQIADGGDYAKYADYVSDGYFHESDAAEHGCSPAFDIIIDGIDSITEQ